MRYYDFPIKEAAPTVIEENPHRLISDAPTDLPLTAKQWTRAAGHRWEQASGFLHHQMKNLGREKRLVHNDWQALWDAYMNRPVK
jgi:hypothetical protein